MNDDDLQFYPVKQDEDVYQVKRKFKEPLQKPPFVKIVVGGKGSGKTSALVSELIRSNMYGDRKKEEPVFDDVILFSGTLGSDSTSRHLVKKCSLVSNTYQDEDISHIVDYQTSKDKKDRRHICLIADDIASMIKGRECEIYKLTSIHRHHLISMYYLVQNPKMIPPVARSNASSYYIYRLPSSKEQEKIFEDLSFLGNSKMIKDLYDVATDKPYHFLYVDVIKNEVWKWGASQPKFLWSKYNENGGYNPPFQKNKKQKEEVDENDIIENDVVNSDEKNNI